MEAESLSPYHITAIRGSFCRKQEDSKIMWHTEVPFCGSERCHVLHKNTIYFWCCKLAHIHRMNIMHNHKIGRTQSFKNSPSNAKFCLKVSLLPLRQEKSFEQFLSSHFWILQLLKMIINIWNPTLLFLHHPDILSSRKDRKEVESKRIPRSS